MLAKDEVRRTKCEGRRTKDEVQSSNRKVRSTKCRVSSQRRERRDELRKQRSSPASPSRLVARLSSFVLRPSYFVLCALRFVLALCFSRWIAVVVAMTVVLVMRSGPVLGLDDSQAVQAAHDRLSRAPWYDADTGRVRPTRVPPRAPPPKIRNWEWKPSTTPGGSSRFAEVVAVLVWIGLVIALTVLVALFIHAFRQRTRRQPGAIGLNARQGGVARDVDRVEKLPIAVRRPQSDLLGEARRYYEAGNYVEAIIYLFSYQLVHLDRHDVVRLAKGKTNRQYLREMKSHDRIVGVVSDTMLVFEDVFFGSHDLDRSRFEVCWRQLDQFHQDVQNVAATGR